MTAKLVALLEESLRGGTFVRLTLLKPSPATDDLQKVIARLVTLKTGQHLSLTYRYPTRDVTKNIPLTDAGKLVEKFRSALLCTTTGDWQLTGKRLIAHPPSTTSAPSRAHDRQKSSPLDDTAEVWLRALAVTAKKRQQIDRYLEIFTHLAKDVGWIADTPKRCHPELVEGSPSASAEILRCAQDAKHTAPAKLVIADMGCGKGYLTFGMWHLLRAQPVRIIGIEQRPELVDTANQLARQIGADGLEFVAGTIESVELPAMDALIALHACDTATDDAIRRGIAAGAKLIVVAPCCHKQVRPQLAKPEPLAPVLEHGLMAERMAEWATDGLRALYLEAAGYRVKMIEFVGTEHTPKNLMIAGIRTGQPAGREQLERFREFFGIRRHALDSVFSKGCHPERSEGSLRKSDRDSSLRSE